MHRYATTQPLGMSMECFGFLDFWSIEEIAVASPELDVVSHQWSTIDDGPLPVHFRKATIDAIEFILN